MKQGLLVYTVVQEAIQQGGILTCSAFVKETV